MVIDSRSEKEDMVWCTTYKDPHTEKDIVPLEKDSSYYLRLLLTDGVGSGCQVS